MLVLPTGRDDIRLRMLLLLLFVALLFTGVVRTTLSFKACWTSTRGDSGMIASSHIAFFPRSIEERLSRRLSLLGSEIGLAIVCLLAGAPSMAWCIGESYEKCEHLARMLLSGLDTASTVDTFLVGVYDVRYPRPCQRNHQTLSVDSDWTSL